MEGALCAIAFGDMEDEVLKTRIDKSVLQALDLRCDAGSYAMRGGVQAQVLWSEGMAEALCLNDFENEELVSKPWT